MQVEPVVQSREPDVRSKQDLRLWLRMLACTNLIERDLRECLRTSFGVTLPRFDFLAALYHADDSYTMGELSQQLMVSNGNITGLGERLESEGLVSRTPWPQDRRTLHVALTDKGRREFERMAVAHESWVAEILSGLSDEQVDDLWRLLGALKDTLQDTYRAKSEGYRSSVDRA